MVIYHNPRCRKSREALTLLQEKGQEPEIRLYLKEPLNTKELSAVLAKLGISATELLRKGEAIYKEKYKGQSLSEEEWIEAMVQHPKLIERPIVEVGEKAIVGRPPERVLELL
ncbi:MAG: arsenate reductase (glutaredoxin) [Bacteroidota bacterium]